jgi:preprotein translocase subunit SecD
MANQYPLWKYLLLASMILLAFLYVIPNVFGDDYAVQVSVKNTANIESDAVLAQVKKTLTDQPTPIPYLSVVAEKNGILARFASTDTQLKARDLLKNALGDDYIVALNLAPKTPRWLQAINANPMKLGLDLRGGVHFLLEVDLGSVLQAREESDLHNITADLREKQIRYIEISHPHNKIVVQFRDKENLDKALKLLPARFTDYAFAKELPDDTLRISATLTPLAITNISNYAVDQNMGILTNRVNELGVSDAIVQRQGETQISVDLPGIQDTARAKDIIGKTATLRWQLVNVEADVQNAVAGALPIGSRLYKYNNAPVLLKNQVILTGASITYATAMMAENGRPAVSIRLGGGGESVFNRITAENIGKPLAVVFVETNPQTQVIDGKTVITRQQVERVINIATIQSALGNNFEITGLSDMKYAQNLALLLRSGALTAPVDFVQEKTVGPSLGSANIHKGILSVMVGSLAVILFMLFYYRVFGLVADLALIVNMLFIVAVLSLLGATLTLPGIAAIVLNVGMAVDANVLIYERIREELRNGLGPQASIHAGYARAFSTIVDSNVTTLLVALVLFALGGGVVKGFAITLTIGILTSMVTAIFFTRALVNLIYGGRNVKRLSIGIHVKGGSTARH